MKSPIVRVALFLIGYMLILLAASVPKGMAPPYLADFVWGAVATVAILALTQLFLKREARHLADVGLAADSRTPLRLLIGLAIGAAVYAVTMLVISLTLGPLTVSAARWPSATTWLLTIVSFMVLSCMEELGFRAYALRTLAGAIGTWRAQAVIAVAFGLSHIAFGWSPAAVVMGVIPSALLFGAVASRSNGLAMPIGLHAMLNIAQWSVGEKDTPGIWALSVEPSQSHAIGTYAPFVGIFVTLLGVFVIWKWPSPSRR